MSISPSPSSSRSASKTVIPSGRAKVNTLPPWAKSHNDDDDLFECMPTRQANNNRILTSSVHTLVSPAGSTSNRSKFSRPSLSTTLVPDSPSRPLPLLNSSGDSSSDSCEAWPRQKPPRLKLRVVSSAPHFSKKGKERGFAKVLEEGAGECDARTVDLEMGDMSAAAATAEHHRPFGSARALSYDAARDPSFYLASGRAASSTDHSPTTQRFRSYGSQQRKRRAAEDEHSALPEEEDHFVSDHCPRRQNHEPDDRWWQFTLPTKYRKKVESYIQRGGHNIGGVAGSWNPSSPPLGMPCHSSGLSFEGSTAINIEAAPATPGAPSTPWQAFADPFNDYRPHQGDFPLSAFSRKLSVSFLRTQLSTTTASKPEPSSAATAADQATTRMGFGAYLVHHPAAPLTFRILNFSLIAGSLALSVRIRRIETELLSQKHGIGVGGGTAVVGTRNGMLYIIIIAPPSLLHILFSIYCEYFGAPIGIWSVRWKMFHTLSELVSISLWSAALALAFDNGLLSPTSIGCGTNSAEVCRLQAGLVCTVFTALATYSLVLVVSLLRIFNKVSRKA